jgi:hypothetical protein
MINYESELQFIKVPSVVYQSLLLLNFKLRYFFFQRPNALAC